jgi:hypothetical protein
MRSVKSWEFVTDGRVTLAVSSRESKNFHVAFETSGRHVFYTETELKELITLLQLILEINRRKDPAEGGVS